jgi:hypothetical protein
MQLPHVQFRLWKLMVAVAILALLIAGIVEVSRGPVVIVEVAPPPESSNPDHDIFDVVLSDLIDNEKFDSAVDSSDFALPKKPQIVLADTTYGQVIGSGLLHLDPDNTRREIPPDIQDDLMRRNPKLRRYTLPHYHPSNPNILVRDLSKVDLDLGFAAQFPNARGYVEPFLPGYSRDGQTAYFRFFFGPPRRSAMGFYLLKKVKGRWEIAWKQLGPYFVQVHPW